MLLEDLCLNRYCLTIMTDALKRKNTGFFNGPYLRFWALYEIMAGRNMMSLIIVFAGVLIGWWVYVPVHELFHALGCILGGGEVTELQIKAIYGGQLLESLIPFVTARGEYAGRLTGFETQGSDMIYAATIAFPYTLTLFSMALMEWSVVRNRLFFFGIMIPVLFAPVISITGDYFELGSLLVYQAWPGQDGVHRILISDDLFRLVHEVRELNHGLLPGSNFLTFIILSLIVGIAMAGMTLSVSHAIGKWSSRH